MRRRGVYDSDAVDRDDEDPFRPGERGRGSRSLVDWTNVSHALVPVAVRDRAIRVSVETDRETATPGEPVGIRVELFNRLPFPIVLRTLSSVRWHWAVDDLLEASHVADHDGGAPALLRFDRRERKTFERVWSGSFRERENQWVAADPGDHEVSAWVNVDDAAGRGLHASTTVHVEEP
jgi:hypothetical protein